MIVDATPSKVGTVNKPIYEKAGIKAIFQGGEKAEIAQCSFNSYCNYNEALNKNSVRVVSCNTTVLARTIGPLKKLGAIGKITVVLVRRAANPVESKKGPINAIVPAFKVPPHHGPDLKTVLPDIDIVSVAVVVPTTIMHLHDGRLYYMQAVHQEAVVIPENIDAIRAITGTEKDDAKSMRITDKSLGIRA